MAGLRDDGALQALADAQTAPVVGQIAEAGVCGGAAVGWSADAPSQDPARERGRGQLGHDERHQPAGGGGVVEPGPIPEVGP